MLTTILSWMIFTFGVSGSLMLALGKRKFIGWLLFLMATTLSIGLAYHLAIWGILATQIVYFICESVGLVNSLRGKN